MPRLSETPPPQTPQSPPLETSADVTIGPLASSAIRSSEQLLAVITPRRAALVACYATARASSAALAGEATLHLTLSPDGHVANALFQGGEALAGALATCVAAAARTWTFGAASEEVRVSVPLTFGASRPVRR